MSQLPEDFWNNKYVEGQTGWDTGAPTEPFVELFKTITDKSIHVLIPGCGHAWEGELLHQLGFKNVVLLDVSEKARTSFLERVPNFPAENYLLGDFFLLNKKFDLILEQTFFCALNPKLRRKYAEKMHALLAEGGELMGVLFKFPLTNQGPPFGGTNEEYITYFQDLFRINKMEDCYNSIPPRRGNELFICLQKH